MKAVLFDFDGVLTTDATGSESICKYIAKHSGIDSDAFEEEYYKYNDDLLYGRKTHKDIWADLCRNLKADIDISVLYDSFINTPIDNKMIALAEDLKRQGIVTGMITDNKKDRIDCIVEHYGWDKLFDIITVSADIGSGKDKQEIFQRTVGTLNLSFNECVFIDNQKKNFIVPKKLGMSVIYFDHVKRDFIKLAQDLKNSYVNLCN